MHLEKGNPNTCVMCLNRSHESGNPRPHDDEVRVDGTLRGHEFHVRNSYAIFHRLASTPFGSLACCADR